MYVVGCKSCSCRCYLYPVCSFFLSLLLAPESIVRMASSSSSAVMLVALFLLWPRREQKRGFLRRRQSWTRGISRDDTHGRQRGYLKSHLTFWHTLSYKHCEFAPYIFPHFNCRPVSPHDVSCPPPSTGWWPLNSRCKHHIMSWTPHREKLQNHNNKAREQV